MFTGDRWQVTAAHEEKRCSDRTLAKTGTRSQDLHPCTETADKGTVNILTEPL